jgi:hypothetical protein
MSSSFRREAAELEFSHLSIIRRMTPSLTRWSRNARRCPAWARAHRTRVSDRDLPMPGAA